jgi:hypothetical protein
MKTIAGYGLTLIAVLALVVAACGIDDTEQRTATPAPTEELTATAQAEPYVVDPLDEYDAQAMLVQYERALSLAPVVLQSMTIDEQLEVCSALTNARTGAPLVEDMLAGFKTTAPDEVFYLVPEDQVKADLRDAFIDACTGA